MANRRWTQAEIKVLLNGIGVSGVKWFTNRCGGRSRSAVESKARRLYGSGGLTRGAHTLQSIIRHTHYSHSQIKRAQSALNQKWKRLGPRGAHIITETQMLDIVSWLRHDYWSKARRLYGCIWCGTSTRFHAGKGLCTRCFRRHWYLCDCFGLPKSNLRQIVVCRSLDGFGDSVFLANAESQLRSGEPLNEIQLGQLRGELVKAEGANHAIAQGD